MPVSLDSPKSTFMFEGEYDPVVASENNAQLRLECDNCGKHMRGTNWDFMEHDWEFEISIDTETLEIHDSSAICPNCNEDIEAEPEDLKPHQKAQNDPMQATIGEIQ